MQHSVYYVASPEACAAILWKSRDKAGTATEALRITSSELVSFGVMDAIVPEPLGAAHADPVAAFPAIKTAIMDAYAEYAGRDGDDIRLDRYAKFRKLGMYEEFLVAGGKWREARAARAGAPGARAGAGTWAPTADDAALIEAIADSDEQWAETLRGKDEWVLKPDQPPGLLRSGVMETGVALAEVARTLGGAAGAAVEERRRQQAELARSAAE